MPPRAVYLRALMAELERLANHFGDIGAICNDASFSLMHAHCGILRERRAARGGRLLRPSADDGPRRARRRRARSRGRRRTRTSRPCCRTIRAALPELVELYDNTASLQDRTVDTGILRAELARQFGAGGYVGRASGRDFDARKTPGYRALRSARLRRAGVAKRRRQCPRLGAHPRGRAKPRADRADPRHACPTAPIRTEFGPAGGTREGLALGPRRSAATCWPGCGSTADRIARCHLRDPSWFQWPLLEAAIEGNIVADFPLCNKSFNCSYSGHDL